VIWDSHRRDSEKVQSSWSRFWLKYEWWNYFIEWKGNMTANFKNTEMTICMIQLSEKVKPSTLPSVSMKHSRNTGRLSHPLVTREPYTLNKPKYFPNKILIVPFLSLSLLTLVQTVCFEQKEKRTFWNRHHRVPALYVRSQNESWINYILSPQEAAWSNRNLCNKSLNQGINKATNRERNKSMK
jgi:hypothetical protein